MKPLCKYLVIVLFSIPFTVFAQKGVLENFISNNANISLTGGQIHFQEKNYWLSSQELFPINTIGIDFETSAIVNRGDFSFDWRGAIHFFIPNEFTINQDNIKITGYKASLLNLGFDFFPKIKKFDLLYSNGISFGKFKQENSYSNGKTSNFRNNFCLLEVSLEPRFVTKYISFSVRPFYGYDITSGSWKGDNRLNDKPAITKIALYGIYASIGVTIFKGDYYKTENVFEK